MADRKTRDYNLIVTLRVSVPRVSSLIKAEARAKKMLVGIGPVLAIRDDDATVAHTIIAPRKDCVQEEGMCSKILNSRAGAGRE